MVLGKLYFPDHSCEIVKFAEFFFSLLADLASFLYKVFQNWNEYFCGIFKPCISGECITVYLLQVFFLCKIICIIHTLKDFYTVVLVFSHINIQVTEHINTKIFKTKWEALIFIFTIDFCNCQRAALDLFWIVNYHFDLNGLFFFIASLFLFTTLLAKRKRSSFKQFNTGHCSWSFQINEVSF